MPFEDYRPGEITALGEAIYREKIKAWWSIRKKAIS